jgi:UrcA family protein
MVFLLALTTPAVLAGPHSPVAERTVPVPTSEHSDAAPSVRIAYHDLDIATPQGIATLYVRIRRAAADVCGAGRPETGTRLSTGAIDACTRRAVDATIRQIGVPGLVALQAEQQALSEAASQGPQCEIPPRPRIII